MRELHFPSLEISTQRSYEKKWKMLSSLAIYPMSEISATAINEWIENKKSWYQSDEYKRLNRGSSTRCNLYSELNLLKTIFNWYKSEDEFENESQNVFLPMRARHHTMAFIRNIPKMADEKKIPVEDAFKFFEKLPLLYRDLALIQFFCAGRIGEIAGIQISNINLSEEYFLIKESVVWCNGNKVFEYLKHFPKNREARRVFIHGQLREVIKRRLQESIVGCDYLFHVNGRPLNYCNIQRHYRAAQKKAEVSYTGTHCLRHGMATLARKVGGMGLDSVIAMTGHKNLRLADHYSRIDCEEQKKTSLKILKHIRSMKLLENDL